MGPICISPIICELPDNAVHHLVQLVLVTQIDEHLFYSDVRAHLHNHLVTNRQVTRHLDSLIG